MYVRLWNLHRSDMYMYGNIRLHVYDVVNFRLKYHNNVGFFFLASEMNDGNIRLRMTSRENYREFRTMNA